MKKSIINFIVIIILFSTLKAELVIVDNIQSLKELKTKQIKKIWVAGFRVVNDGGQGFFYWDSLSTEKEIPGLIISPISIEKGRGRWMRVFDEEINIKWLGAKGDGITDNSPKIKSIISFVRKIGGGTVYFPKGKYAISEAISVCENLKIIGDGMHLTRILPLSTFSDIALLRIEKTDNVKLESFELSGKKSELKKIDSYSGIYIYQSNNLNINNLYIHNFQNGGIRVLKQSTHVIIMNSEINDIAGIPGASGVIIDDSKYCRISFCKITNCNPKDNENINRTDDGNGIFFHKGSDGGWAFGNIFKNCGRRAIKVQSSSIRVSENYIEDCAQAGIQVQLLPKDGGPIEDILLSNNIIKNIRFGNYGVVLENYCKNILISNLIIDNVYAGIEIRHGVQGVKINQCSIKNTKAWGIRIEQLETNEPPITQDILISNNKLNSCGNQELKPSIEVRAGKTPVELVSIYNNHILNSANYSISIKNKNMRYIKIANNTLNSFKFENSPIYFPSGANNLYQNNTVVTVK